MCRDAFGGGVVSAECVSGEADPPLFFFFPSLRLPRQWGWRSLRWWSRSTWLLLWPWDLACPSPRTAWAALSPTSWRKPRSETSCASCISMATSSAACSETARPATRKVGQTLTASGFIRWDLFPTPSHIMILLFVSWLMEASLLTFLCTLSTPLSANPLEIFYFKIRSVVTNPSVGLMWFLF